MVWVLFFLPLHKKTILNESSLNSTLMIGMTQTKLYYYWRNQLQIHFFWMTWAIKSNVLRGSIRIIKVINHPSWIPLKLYHLKKKHINSEKCWDLLLEKYCNKMFLLLDTFWVEISSECVVCSLVKVRGHLDKIEKATKN